MRWLIASQRVVLADDARAEMLLELRAPISISSCSILPTGMPVQPEITSPTICASTQTRISGVSPCSCIELGVRVGQFRAQRFAIGWPAAAWPAAALPRLRRGTVSRHGLRSCRAVRGSRLTRSRSFSKRACSSTSFASVSAVSLRDLAQPLGVVGARRRLRASSTRFCTCEVVEPALSVFELRRHRVLSERQPRASRIQDADRFVRQLAVRQCSDATAARPHATPSSRMRTL